jgi:hypothetical protein
MDDELSGHRTCECSSQVDSTQEMHKVDESDWKARRYKWTALRGEYERTIVGDDGSGVMPVNHDTQWASETREVERVGDES